MLPVCYGLLGYLIYPLPHSLLLGSASGFSCWDPHFSVGGAGISELFGIACSAGIIHRNINEEAHYIQ